jgi:hypothetical protein
MNTYLLLRDNKKSGPFTADELRTMGLKPYDLVWLEGKSAAWRYPGEIDELKSFAPVVEEQPYDRFYKKPATDNNSAVTQPVEEVKKAAEPVYSARKENISTGSGRVIVTLPGNNARPVTSISSQKPVEPPKTQISQPIKESKPEVEPKKVEEESVAHFYTESAKPRKAIYMDTDEQYATIANSSSKNIKTNRQLWLMRGLAAACFLFAGLCTGLFINYRSQQNNIQELKSLVKQIQHSTPSQPVTEKAPEESNLPGTSLLDEPSTSDDFVETETVNEEAEIARSVANKKEKPANLNQTTKNITPDTSTEVKAVPAILKEEAIHNELPSKDVAKKNLIQQIKISNNKYKTGILGGISGLQLVLANKSGYPLDKVEVEINYLGPEKRVVKSQVVYFRNVPPGEETTLDVPKSNRGVSVEYSIKKIDSRELDLVHVAR